jgi:hypothetical protein
LTVKAVPPSGDNGIAAIDAAGGATNVSATGQVTTTSGYGIVAINGATTLSPVAAPTFRVSTGNATDLNVNAASVFGGLYGHLHAELRYRHNAYHHERAGAGRHQRHRCHFGRRPGDCAQRND